MATSRPKPTGPSSRKATSRSAGRRAGPQEVEVVEEAGGLDLEAGIGVVTFLLLIVALVLVDYEMGKHMAAGILFK